MSIPAWARVGAEVVCVRSFQNARTVYDQGYRSKPAINKTYRLTWVDEYPDLGVTVCCLDGFPSAHAFDLKGFRPAISQADDISTHFQTLLSTPVKKEEDA
jgi:hypothetical protein